MNIDNLTLDIQQHIEVQAPIDKVFQAMLHRFGEGNTRPDGESLQLLLEAWPGGRWYRDRGNGIGHLWGHVQVIKPPELIELSGPMFMSYPAINHVEIKLSEASGLVKVTLRHRALGMIADDHRKGVNSGWKHMLDAIAADFVPTAAGRRS
ncbi:MAG: SRPBCC domain-containing protein [Acidobacteriota bacterium]